MTLLSTAKEANFDGSAIIVDLWSIHDGRVIVVCRHDGRVHNVNHKNIAGRFFVLVTKHACGGQTDGRKELRLPRPR